MEHARAGADAIAADYAAPARPGTRSKAGPPAGGCIGRAAGYRRNAEMIASGADGCVAFVRDGSPGSSATVAMAKAAGIPVWLHTQP